jgi:hypothetical protein
MWSEVLCKIRVLDLRFSITLQIEDGLYEFFAIHGLDVGGHWVCHEHWVGFWVAADRVKLFSNMKLT